MSYRFYEHIAHAGELLNLSPTDTHLIPRLTSSVTWLPQLTVSAPLPLLSPLAGVKEIKIGEGTYANVYKGHDARNPSRTIAIKKIKAGAFKDGIDISAIREIKFLRELKHPNVVALLDTFTQSKNLNLVLEFLDTDLEAVIKDRSLLFRTEDVKSWMMMSMRGLEWCHRQGILHRVSEIPSLFPSTQDLV